jgi:hypothetical protein
VDRRTDLERAKARLTAQLAAAALTDGRAIPTIRLDDMIRKHSLSFLVKRRSIETVADVRQA